MGIPNSGGGDIWKAAQLRNTPIWAYHSRVDRAVPVNASREMVHALAYRVKLPNPHPYPSPLPFTLAPAYHIGRCHRGGA